MGRGCVYDDESISDCHRWAIADCGYGLVDATRTRVYVSGNEVRLETKQTGGQLSLDKEGSERVGEVSGLPVSGKLIAMQEREGRRKRPREVSN